jgi:L-aspartate oxidase
LQVSREAAHSARRIVRVQGDMAGRAIMAALTEVVRKTPSIHVLEGLSAEELIVAQGAIMGAKARDAAGRLVTLPASAVVLATGGIGHLYAVTTNPSEARGIGLAIAARAGALLADTEFVQFHPTAIDIGQDPAPLATEALRGDGALLVNRQGEQFMRKLHPDGDLAPRDIVARGVFAEIAAGRGAFLDAREAIGASFMGRFPTVYASCMAAGINPALDLIPIAPAQHYHMGGVAVDERGRTSIPNLWAAGEVACTGVHGANRLASNSLLEAVVFGARVAQDIRGLRFKAPITPGKKDFVSAVTQPVQDDELRQIMARHVGVIRDAEGLARALADIARIERTATSRALRNMATAALLIAAAAWKRQESRGGHYRSDYPKPDPAQANRTFLTLDDARAIAARATARPVPAL